MISCPCWVQLGHTFIPSWEWFLNLMGLPLNFAWVFDRLRSIDLRSKQDRVNIRNITVIMSVDDTDIWNNVNVALYDLFVTLITKTVCFQLSFSFRLKQDGARRDFEKIHSEFPGMVSRLCSINSGCDLTSNGESIPGFWKFYLSQGCKQVILEIL